MIAGRRWAIQDRYGNTISLSDERWKHIIDPWNHPEMRNFESHIRDVIRFGSRRQDPLNVQKYRYTRSFDDLAEGNTHIVAIVLFRFLEEANRQIQNNYIVTAYQKEIR